MRKLAVEAKCIVLFAVVTFGSSNAALAQSVAPKNLRVTGVTDWTVALMWDAPKGKAPSSYVVQCSNGRSMPVAGSQTTATFSSGFDYNRTYSFRVYAVTSSGAWSSASNTVTATLLSDTTPAAKPVVSSTGNGPTHVDLAWSYGDSDPSPRFDIYVNGQLWHGHPLEVDTISRSPRATLRYTQYFVIGSSTSRASRRPLQIRMATARVDDRRSRFAARPERRRTGSRSNRGRSRVP
jgi:fibronectin type III domain protein